MPRDYSQDTAILRIKSRPLPANARTLRPETLRCGCGWSTDRIIEAWVHGWVDHAIRLCVKHKIG